MSTKRLFLALNPDDTARADLVDVQRGIAIENLRLTPAANLHVTVKFLGDVPDEDIPELIEALELMSETVEPFEATIDQLEYLPNIRRPRVLAARVQKTDPMVRLFEAAEEAAAACGFQREGRAFHPHITVGRFRRGKKPPRLPSAETFGPLETGFSVRRLILMQSLLEPTGPSYAELADFTL